MIAGTLAFLAGVVLLQSCPVLPGPGWWALALFALPALRARALIRLCGCLLSGFLWAWVHAALALSTALEDGAEGIDLVAEGTVTGIPTTLPDGGSRFLFVVRRYRESRQWHDRELRLRLSWYRDAPELRSGQRWRLVVRLKRPHGFANPGGFDYERWLFAQGIAATGYVRSDERNRRLGRDSRYWLDSQRQGLADKIGRVLGDRPSLALVQALTVGERSALTAGQWEVLRTTGTSHLMAISGLHISLVTGLVFWLSRGIWARIPRLSESLPAVKAAAVAALHAAFAYALLAGLSIPTRRALVMVTVVMAGLMWGRRITPSRSLCVAVLAVLAFDPLSVLDNGFWLSFGAVSFILYATQGRHDERRGWRWWCRRWGRLQIALLLGLMPLMLLFFRQASLVAPLANLVAVPWVGLLVVPVALVGTLLAMLSGAGDQCLLLAGWLLDLAWPVLAWLARLPPGPWIQHTPPLWTLMPALAGVVLVLAPAGFPARWSGLILLAPLFLVAPARPAPGSAWLTLLDVGQGLAAIVRTRHHVLVYDTGPRYSDGFDTGMAVVVPYLRHLGIHRVDTMMISHGDNDHIGGAQSVLRLIETGSILSGAPDRLSRAGAEPCVAGQAWRWDGVGFRVLHPRSGLDPQGNNASCVLRIEAADGASMLLTGDIESGVEQALLAESPDALKATVLVVPHHGSLTSSTAGFVAAVEPDYALFAAGYRNRYGLPHQRVIRRYRRRGARVLDTARHGAITVRLGDGGDAADVSLYRPSHLRYWNHPG